MEGISKTMDLFRRDIRRLCPSFPWHYSNFGKALPHRSSWLYSGSYLDTALDFLRVTHQCLAMSALRKVFHWQMVVWQPNFELVHGSALRSLRIAEAGKGAGRVPSARLTNT